LSLPFLIPVGSPFLFDSYSHVVNAAREDSRQVLWLFYQHPTAGDFFFRPLGYFDYWLEAKWAGLSPAAWHWNGIVLHFLAALLVFFLATRLSLSRIACFFTAAIFVLHASNPEVVSWTAARFDQLAICFTLTSLLFLCRYVDTGRGYVPMTLACLCAAISKESALCLPALAICTLAYRGGRPEQRSINAIIGLTLTTFAVLTYRFWVLGGIGGYRNAAGAPTAVQINLPHLFELLFFRMWSVLMLPINWSSPSQWWLIVGLGLLAVGSAAAMILARPSRRKTLAAIGFCVVALLPANHLALLDATLLGSRVYHLAVIGFALLLGAIYDGFDNQHFARLAAGCFLLFQLVALTHNLLIWRSTAQLAGGVCNSFPAALKDGETVIIPNLPRAHDGVFFLSNAFSECLLVNSGKQIKVLPAGTPGLHQKLFLWDDASNSLILVP
jgi:hypothetical protein